MMKLLEKFNWNNFNYFDPIRYHIQAEVSKVCFEIKETILGDPQFNKIDIDYHESDIKNKKLSVSSPLARGLINKTIDDVVEINSPKGQKSYTIKSIKYV